MSPSDNTEKRSQMLIYITEDGLTKIETVFDGNTVGCQLIRWPNCSREIAV